MCVSWDEQVNQTVPIVISPRGPCRKTIHIHPSLRGYIFKSTVAFVPVENRASKSGDVDGLLPVIVQIADSNPHSPTFATQAGIGRDVLEFQSGLLMIERDHGISTSSVSLYS